MSDDDLPEFYIEAAQVVVGMHPFQSEAGTGIAIEAVRRAILQARSKAYEECAKIADNGRYTTFMAWDIEGSDPVSVPIPYREEIAIAIRSKANQ